LQFSLLGIAKADNLVACFVSSGIPYIYGGSCDYQFYKNYLVGFDYGAGILENDYKAGIELSNEIKRGAFVQSIGLEFGSRSVITHSLSLPYDWVGVTLKEKMHKNFDCCGDRLGWYIYGSASLENRKYHEIRGVIVKEKNEVGLGLGVGLSFKVL